MEVFAYQVAIFSVASTMESMLEKLMHLDFSVPWVKKLFFLFLKRGVCYRLPFGPSKGMKMHFDRGMSFHMILGLEDLGNFKVLKRVFDAMGWGKNSKFGALDLGANRGFYSLWLSKFFSKVFSFEPNPEVFALLEKNRAVNLLDNIETIQKGVSDESGSFEMYVGAEDFTGFISGVDTGGKSSRTFSIETITLDEFFSTHEIPIKFIKMDIEGAGALALKGASSLIEKNRPILYFESHSSQEDKAVGQLMLRFNYAAFRLTNSKWVIDATSTHPNPDGVWGNLLVIPKEYLSKLRPVLL